MPLFKYISGHPLMYPSDDILDFIDRKGEIPAKDAMRPEDFLRLFSEEGYDSRELGYTCYEDGSGYLAFYRIRPAGVTAEMESWYHNWSCGIPAHTVEGHGNLRFKLWHPADHIEKYYVNWKDFTFGMYQKDCFSADGNDIELEYVRHPFDLARYGLTEEMVAGYAQKGVYTNRQGYFNAYTDGGSSFSVSASRKLPDGRTEIRTRVWVGCRPLNGTFMRDPAVRCSPALLKALLIHRIMEWEHLYEFLPELYEEYSNLAADAD